MSLNKIWGDFHVTVQHDDPFSGRQFQAMVAGCP
jgi:hypothetical protein